MTIDAREQAIREIAYSKWEQAGSPGGDGLNFWLEAEQQILGQETCESFHHESSSISDPPPLLLAKVKANSRKKAG